ncbi:MAG: DUF4388 domain-containing protein [Blastochloris sp.]|nr:DUF4388 domain-containing protein [Blastochloris sp.]
MKLGLAIWPKANAEWIELALSHIKDLSSLWIGPDQVRTLDLFELIVVDGDSPGPSFLAYYKAYASQHGSPHLVVLGTPMSPALATLPWEPEKTRFVSKPYRMEDVVLAVNSSLTLLNQDLAPALHPPPPPTPSSAPGKASGAKSLGYLSTLRLSDLIQMLCLSNWTGKIEVTELGQNKQGEIFLNVGVLIHAEQGSHEAEEACYTMLGWGRCEFNFVEEHPPVVQTISTPWQGIMLEGARKIDEAQTG